MTDNIKDLVSAIADTGGSQNLRFRFGQISSVNSNGSANITIAGSTTVINNVKVSASCCPIPNATCVIATDGRDLFVFSTLAPSGPAFGSSTPSAVTTLTTATWTDIDFTNRTNVIANGITATNTGFTIVVPGIYQVTTNCTFNGNTTGLRFGNIAINGSIGAYGTGSNALSNASYAGRLDITATFKLAINDTVGVQQWQNSGGNLNTNVNTAQGANKLTVTWLGPSA